MHAAAASGTRFLLAEPGKRPWFLIDGLVNVDSSHVLNNAELFSELWRAGGRRRITSKVGTDLGFELADRP